MSVTPSPSSSSSSDGSSVRVGVPPPPPGGPPVLSSGGGGGASGPLPSNDPVASGGGESASPSASLHRSCSVGRVCAAVLVNWLLPGAGYFLVGERARAWTLAVLLNGMFFLGLILQGGVVPPETNFRSPTFNVINVLTFGVQMGAGGPSALSWGANELAEKGNVSPLVRFFAGEESAAAHDLGVFHLLIVGALNYFACCMIYDRFRRRSRVEQRTD